MHASFAIANFSKCPLAERDPPDQASRMGLGPKDWMIDLTNTLDARLDPALEDVGAAATFGAAVLGIGKSLVVIHSVVQFQ